MGGLGGHGLGGHGPRGHGLGGLRERVRRRRQTREGWRQARSRGRGGRVIRCPPATQATPHLTDQVRLAFYLFLSKKALCANQLSHSVIKPLFAFISREP